MSDDYDAAEAGEARDMAHDEWQERYDKVAREALELEAYLEDMTRQRDVALRTYDATEKERARLAKLVHRPTQERAVLSVCRHERDPHRLVLLLRTYKYDLTRPKDSKEWAVEHAFDAGDLAYYQQAAGQPVRNRVGDLVAEVARHGEARASENACWRLLRMVLGL